METSNRAWNLIKTIGTWVFYGYCAVILLAKALGLLIGIYLVAFQAIAHFLPNSPKQGSPEFYRVGILAAALLGLAVWLLLRSDQITDSVRARLRLKPAELRRGVPYRGKYVATRFFAVDGPPAKGPAVFFELEDGSTLLLAGKYLRPSFTVIGSRLLSEDYPKSEFSITRYRDDPNNAFIKWSGIVLKPDSVLPPIDEASYHLLLRHEGTTLRGCAYEAIRDDLKSFPSAEVVLKILGPPPKSGLRGGPDL